MVLAMKWNQESQDTLAESSPEPLECDALSEIQNLRENAALHLETTYVEGRQTCVLVNKGMDEETLTTMVFDVAWKAAA